MDLIRSDSCEKFFDRKNYLSKTDLEDQIFGSFYVLSNMTFLPPDYEKSLFKRPIIISSCQKEKIPICSNIQNTFIDIILEKMQLRLWKRNKEYKIATSKKDSIVFPYGLMIS